MQRVIFSNEELKRQQRDIELVNNEIVNPEMKKITLQLDFMQQETLVYNNEFMKTRTILNDLEDNILQSKNNTKGLKILKIAFGRMTIDLDRHIISGTLL